MKLSSCIHIPKKFAKPRTNKCEGGDTDNVFELRVCLTCGYVGCCEDDPGQHALKHAQETGHSVIASYPADKDSFTPLRTGAGFIWCYKDNDYLKTTL